MLDHLDIPELHVAGYSLGGYLGLLLALNQPRRVSTLLMHATKFYWTKESAKNMQDQLDPDKMVKTVPAYANQLMEEHGGRQWRTLVRQAVEMTFFMAESGIREAALKHLRQPVLVSLGDRDEMVPLPEAVRLSRILPNGGLIVLPGTRHAFQSIRPVPLLPMMQNFHQTRD